MNQFLVGVSKMFEVLNPKWTTAPDVSWNNHSGQVKAWIWGDRTPDRHAGELQLTIGNAVNTAVTVSPYVNVRLDRTGRGEIVQDPLGLHPLYTGTHSGTTFVSNNPHRIAAILSAARGATVRKCLSLSACLVSGERPMGFKTGYEGILCTPFATRLKIHPVRGVEYAPQHSPWSRDAGVLDRAEADSVIDRCTVEMVENMRSYVADAECNPTLQLTGGYDSRLVLALAIKAGVLKDVDVVTYGDAKHPDALIAAELTRRLRIGHSILPATPNRNLRDHVYRTAGMMSCRLGSEPKTGAPLILHGLLGETFRSNIRTQTPIRSREQLIACWLQPQAYSGLLRREAQIAALTEGMEMLLAPLDEHIRPELGMDIFYIQHLARRWISVRPDFFAQVAFPLYCPTAIRLALQMGWTARKHAFLHETVTARVGGALLDVPYVEGKEPRSLPTLGQLGVDIGPSKTLEPRFIATSWYDNTLVNRRPRTRTLQVTLSSEQTEEINTRQAKYREFFHEIPRNSIWDVLDREKVREAIDHLPMLDVRARQDLDAAMAGVLWHST